MVGGVDLVGFAVFVVEVVLGAFLGFVVFV